MNYLEKLNLINARRAESKNAMRIASELTYLDNISKYKDRAYNGVIETAMDYILAQIDIDGVITANTMLEAENLLSELKEVAKSYKQIFQSHAHIDMNWMWGYNETAAITIETFKTVLQLMREYPEFTFGQSQASTYEIIERFCPEMLEEIKLRIKEGRWEVNACEWVEPDKNMPDGESLTRQILQTKKYLSELLDIEAESLNLDFVPDTFGHNLNVPEILSDAGVKYMYHCRGFEGKTNIYRYRSPSGKSTLNYREYGWYNGFIKPNNFECVPDFCHNNKVDTFLCVYGVGDHGGGPSRRDIERIKEYSSWPYTPSMKFGTLREYFSYLENSGVDFPVINTEINFLLTGCYTTQTRIKMANRIAEARINEAEQINASAFMLAGAIHKKGYFDRAWRNILFNHFHDILPGSGTIETREYAMGLFQDTMAYVNTAVNADMKAIADKIDTSSIDFAEVSDVESEGAGVGYFQDEQRSFRITATERGRGPTRALHIFNTTGYEREEFCEIILWDYNYDHNNIAVKDIKGNYLDFSILEQGEGYWDHKFTKLLVKVKVSAFGYTTVVVCQEVKNRTIKHPDFYAPLEFNNYQPLNDFRINDEPIVLESDYIKAIFCKETFHIISLIDKESGKELIKEPTAFFKFIEENPHYGMSSWRVGPVMKSIDLNKECMTRFTGIKTDNTRSVINYEIAFSQSNLKVGIVLKKNSRVLEFNVVADWSEVPDKGKRIPQLTFSLPLGYTAEGAIYDIPYGEIERKPLAHDVPALSFMSMPDSEGRGLAITTDSKYGYRFWNNEGQVNLIHSPYEPDPYPDRGIHNIRIGIIVGENKDMKHQADCFNHPMPYIPATCHEGELPPENQVLKVDGDVRVSVVKKAENANGLAVRIYDASGKQQSIRLSFAKPVSNAYITDSNENIISAAQISEGAVKLIIEPYSVVTIVSEF